MRLITGFILLCATSACSPQENGSATDSPTSTDSTDSTDSTSTSTTDPTTTDSTAPTGTTDTPGTTDPTSTTDSTGTSDPTAATSTEPGTDTDESSSTTGAPVDEDCAFLVGRVFLSDEELECGKGPNGVEMCPWQLTFTADTFDHQLSDFGLQGTYTCKDGIIDAVDMQQLAHGGTIDAATGELVWDEIVYHQKGG
ncbi:hypothetical protein [Nannocystis pusilla]|uniref:hypothetical protein n=1 Tax=Nannocystis pusilla TaxID=889268 RepID=UPI003B7AB6AB